MSDDRDGGSSDGETDGRPDLDRERGRGGSWQTLSMKEKKISTGLE